MIQINKYTAAVSNAQRDLANTTLAGISGSLWNPYDPDGMFTTALIQNADPDDMDPPRYWATVFKVTANLGGIIKGALDAAGVTTLKYEGVNSRKPVEDEDLIDAWAAEWGYRRPGHIMCAYGTAEADGTATAQDLTTTPILLQQWTDWVKRRNMTKDATSQRYVIPLDGTYELGSRLPHVPVEGVAFYARAVRNTTLVLGTLNITEDIDGKVEGPLDAGQKVGIAVWSSAPAQFKLLSGAKIRLKRTA